MENQKIVDKWEIEGDDNEETLKRLKKHIAKAEDEVQK